MMVFLVQLTVPSAAPTQLSQCINPDHLKTRRLENNLCRCGKSWLTSLKFSFLMQMDEGVFILPALDARSQTLSIKDRRNGSGKPVFKLAPLGSGQTFTLVAPDLSVPGISTLRCYNGFSLKPTGLMCDGRPLASPLFRCLTGRGFFLYHFLFRCDPTLCVLI